MEALIKRSRTAAAPPTKLRTGLPRKSTPILFRAMPRRPAQRYPTWTDFSIELSNLADKMVARRRDPR